MCRNGCFSGRGGAVGDAGLARDAAASELCVGSSSQTARLCELLEAGREENSQQGGPGSGRLLQLCL